MITNYQGNKVIADVDLNRVIICAFDSSDKDKASADYVCNGVNDEITINNAFSSLSPMQDLYFCKGTYNIDSFLSATDGKQNYVINMPCDKINRHRLICEGGNPTKTSSSGSDVGTFTNCALFKVSQSCYNNLSSNAEYSIIRCNSVNGTRQYTKNSLWVEGFAFQIPDNQKKICCIDGLFASQLFISNVMALCLSSTTNLRVATEKCIGIRGVQGSNFGCGNIIKSCFVWGFYEGYAIAGEHLVCFDLGARFCNYGFTFNNFSQNTGAWIHPITLINCADECNFNMPLFGHNGEAYQNDSKGGRQAINLIDFNLEWISQYYALGGQYAKELTKGEWFGEITYIIQPSYGGNSKNAIDIPFWANDGSGKNVKTTNLAQMQQANKTEILSYAPNYNQIVYCTDLAKTLICTNPSTREWRDFNGNVVSLT